jgi:hypothetical protein
MMTSSHSLILKMLLSHWKPTKHLLSTKRKEKATEMLELVGTELETTHLPSYVGD